MSSELRFLPTPPAFDSPVSGGGVRFRRNIAMPFGVEKLELLDLPTVEKVGSYVYLFRQNPRMFQTNTQTDRHRMTAYDA